MRLLQLEVEADAVDGFDAAEGFTQFLDLEEAHVVLPPSVLLPLPPGEGWGEGTGRLICMLRFLLSPEAGTRPGRRLTFFCFAKRK